MVSENELNASQKQLLEELDSIGDDTSPIMRMDCEDTLTLESANKIVNKSLLSRFDYMSDILNELLDLETDTELRKEYIAILGEHEKLSSITAMITGISVVAQLIDKNTSENNDKYGK